LETTTKATWDCGNEPDWMTGVKERHGKRRWDMVMAQASGGPIGDAVKDAILPLVQDVDLLLNEIANLRSHAHRLHELINEATGGRTNPPRQRAGEREHFVPVDVPRSLQERADRVSAHREAAEKKGGQNPPKPGGSVPPPPRPSVVDVPEGVDYKFPLLGVMIPVKDQAEARRVSAAFNLAKGFRDTVNEVGALALDATNDVEVSHKEERAPGVPRDARVEGGFAGKGPAAAGERASRPVPGGGSRWTAPSPAENDPTDDPGDGRPDGPSETEPNETADFPSGPMDEAPDEAMLQKRADRLATQLLAAKSALDAYRAQRKKVRP
jgi:hypothetical protein